MIKKMVAIVALGIVLLIAGCNTPVSTPTSHQVSNVGGGLEVHAVPVVNPPQVLGIGHVTPKPGYIFVAFNCTLKDVNAQPASGAPQYESNGYWNLVDRGGHNYYGGVYTDIAGDGTPGITAFETRYMNPGDVVNGYVFFEVPSGSVFNYIYYWDAGVYLVVPL